MTVLTVTVGLTFASDYISCILFCPFLFVFISVLCYLISLRSVSLWLDIKIVFSFSGDTKHHLPFICERKGYKYVRGVLISEA